MAGDYGNQHGEVEAAIDLGHNLPQGDKPVEDKMDNPETIAALCEGCDAIFYTHYHADHFGLLTESDRRILFVMTRGTYEMLCVNDIMRRKNLIQNARIVVVPQIFHSIAIGPNPYRARFNIVVDRHCR